MKRRGVIALVALVAIFGLVAVRMQRNSAGAPYEMVSQTLSSDDGAATDAAPAPEMALMEEPAAGNDALFSRMDGEQTGQQGGAAPPQAPQDQARERLVIKTAGVEAEAPYEALPRIVQRVETMVAGLGGYIVSTDDSTSSEARDAYATVVFRVPVANFEQAISGLATDGMTITNRTISGQDVTEEFVDIESRLRNLEATVERLRGFLADAETVDEAIMVNNTLVQYESEIEMLKGRRQYLTDSAAMSMVTFTVHSLYEPIVVEPTPPPAWSPAATAERAFKELLGVGRDLVDLLIVVAVWAPIWLPLLLIGRYAYRYARQRLEPAPKAAPPAPAPPQPEA